jgi:hypothetical protein
MLQGGCQTTRLAGNTTYVFLAVCRVNTFGFTTSIAKDCRRVAASPGNARPKIAIPPVRLRSRIIYLLNVLPWVIGTRRINNLQSAFARGFPNSNVPIAPTPPRGQTVCHIVGDRRG